MCKTESELCIECQWCCTHSNVPVPFNEGHNTQEEFAYLYWLKGRTVYWEPFTNEWYWLAHSPCQHLDETEGCKIYEDRPRLCRAGGCPFGPYRMWDRYEAVCSAGDRIMKQIHARGTYK